MAYSYNEVGLVSPGGTIAVSFPFLSRDHVSVTVDGTVVNASLWTWTNDGLVTANSGFPSGTRTRVRRVTPLSLEGELKGAASLDYPMVNSSFTRMLYISQERDDAQREQQAELDALDTSLVNQQSSLDASVELGRKWAEEGEGVQITPGHYSSYHWAKKGSASASEAAGSATSASSDASSTAADRIAVAADKAVVSGYRTDAAGSATSASSDASSTAADRIAVAADKAVVAGNKVTTEGFKNVASDAAITATNAQAATESARDSALAAYANFSDVYLGAHSTPPTKDTDGSALEPGDLYYDSTGQRMQVWSGTSWVAAYVSASGVPLLANNGSDYNSPAFRTNLSVYSKAESNAAFATAGQGAKADDALSRSAGGTVAGRLNASGAFRGDGWFALGREGGSGGGLYFNRNPDNPFVLFSYGDPAVATTDIGQLRASGANKTISITGTTGAPNYLSVHTDTGVVEVLNEPTIAKSVATKGFVDARASIGINQAWLDVTASRAVATVYQNTTGRPIQVAVQARGQNGVMGISLDNVTWTQVGQSAGLTNGYQSNINIIVPHGHYYRMTGADSISKWVELG